MEKDICLGRNINVVLKTMAMIRLKAKNLKTKMDLPLRKVS